MLSTQNGFNIHTSPTDVIKYLEATYFNKNHTQFLNSSTLEEILSKYKTINSSKHLFLLKMVFEKELDYQESRNSKIEYRYEVLSKKQYLNLELRKKYIGYFWSRGDRDKFLFYSEQIINHYLAIKNYESVNQVIVEIQGYEEFWLLPYYAQLLSCLEIRDLEAAIVAADKIELLLIHSWSKLKVKKHSKIEYLEKLYHILLEKSEDELILVKYILALKLKLYHHTEDIKYLFKKEELLKVFILFHNDNDVLAGILPLLKNAVLAEEIKMAKPFNLFSLKNRFPLTYEKLRFKIQAKEVISQTNPVNETYDIESYHLKKIDIDKILDKYPSSDSKDEVEKQLIKQINLGLFRNDENIEQIFVALESMSFYEAAKICLNKKEEDINQLYLFCEILLKQHSYAECLYEIDLRILSKQLPARLSLEFKYLKAEALRGLKRNKDARAMFMEIIAENPDYRSVKERVKDA